MYENINTTATDDPSKEVVAELLWTWAAQLPFLLITTLICFFTKEGLEEKVKVASLSNLKEPRSWWKNIFVSLVGPIVPQIAPTPYFTNFPHKQENYVPLSTNVKDGIDDDSLSRSSDGSSSADLSAIQDASPPDEKKSTTAACRGQIQRTRERFALIESSMHSSACILWDKMVKKNKGDQLIGGTAWVPRNSNILNEWNIAPSPPTTPSLSTSSPSTPFSTCSSGDELPLEIDIICPSSLLTSKDTIFENSSDRLAYKKFKKCNLSDLKLQLKAAPIILYFHGGEYTMGATRDGFPSIIHSLLSQQLKKSKGQTQPLFFASVNYRLAPEHPFPGAIIDCLSAANYFIKSFPDSDIHLAGISAGGNAATVVGFECVRQVPGRIKRSVIIFSFISANYTSVIIFHFSHNIVHIFSMMVGHPMLIPRSQLSATSSVGIFPRPSLIDEGDMLWNWAAYLQIGDYKDKTSYLEALMQHPLFRLGRIGSINPLLRLVWPQVDIPTKDLVGVNQSSSSDTMAPPRVFICTASADPLRNDGINLIDSLRDKGIKVDTFESHGDHGISFYSDRKWRKAFVEQWSSCIWH